MKTPLPVGTTAVGRTLIPVDTRVADIGVRAVLPYGMGRKGQSPPLSQRVASFWGV